MVVGGGWGRLGAVRALAEGGRRQVTLVEPGFVSLPRQLRTSQPGGRPAADFKRSCASIDRPGGCCAAMRERALELDRTRPRW